MNKSHSCRNVFILFCGLEERNTSTFCKKTKQSYLHYSLHSSVSMPLHLFWGIFRWSCWVVLSQALVPEIQNKYFFPDSPFGTDLHKLQWVKLHHWRGSHSIFSTGCRLHRQACSAVARRFVFWIPVTTLICYMLLSVCTTLCPLSGCYY